MNTVLLFALAGAVTFGIRASLVVAGDRPAVQGVVSSHARRPLEAADGAIAFARIPRAPYSSATLRMKLFTPAFAAP